MRLTTEQLLEHKKKLQMFHKQDIYNRILDLKDTLLNSDYQAIKYAEGLISEEEYAPIKAQRQAWREEINKLEAEWDALNS